MAAVALAELPSLSGKWASMGWRAQRSARWRWNGRGLSRGRRRPGGSRRRPQVAV